MKKIFLPILISISVIYHSFGQIDHGIEIDSVTDTALKIIHADGDGAVIQSSGANGLEITDAGASGIHVTHAANNGVTVSAADGYGIYATGSTAAGFFLGNVGVGAATPSARLHTHIFGSNANYYKATNDVTGTTSNDGLDLGVDPSGNGVIWLRENSTLRFGTNNAQRMTILNDGSVGIGTSIPTRQLHVHSGGATSNFVKVTNGTTGGLNSDGLDVGVESDGDAIVWMKNKPLLFATNNTTRMIIDETGKVAIGGNTAPEESLHIRTGNTANIRLGDIDPTGGTKDWSIESSAPGFHIKDLGQTGANQFKLSINGITGDIGMGAAVPSADLDIARSTTYSRVNAGDATFTVSSSRSLKENITPYLSANILDKIDNVPVNEYDWKNEAFSGEEENRTGKLGLIAEDFHTILGRGSDKEINGNEVIMVLWMAVQELHQEIELLKASMRE